MNPVTAHMPPALMLMMSGPTPTNGVFQDLLDMSVIQTDAPPSLPVNVVTCAETPVCPPAITFALPPLAGVQNWTATDALPQATAPENSIEDADIVVAERSEAASPIDSALVARPMVQMRPLASAPIEMPAPQIAPHARTLPATAETPKPLREARIQWPSGAAKKPEVRIDEMPDERPDVIPGPLLTKENKPQVPAPLLPHNLGVVDDHLFRVEPQSGITTASTSVAATAPPTSTPLAELRQLVITADGEWVGALARDIVHHAARDNQLAFTLIPEHLGQLDVAVTTDNGTVDIRLETSTPAAAQAIATEYARLIEDLRHAGLKLGQFDMSNRQNGNGQQQAPQPDNQRTDNDSTPAQAKASSKAQGRFA